MMKCFELEDEIRTHFERLCIGLQHRLTVEIDRELDNQALPPAGGGPQRGKQPSRFGQGGGIDNDPLGFGPRRRNSGRGGDETIASELGWTGASCGETSLEASYSAGAGHLLLTVVGPALSYLNGKIVFALAIRTRNRHTPDCSDRGRSSHTCSIQGHNEKPEELQHRRTFRPRRTITGTGHVPQASRLRRCSLTLHVLRRGRHVAQQ